MHTPTAGRTTGTAGTGSGQAGGSDGFSNPTQPSPTAGSGTGMPHAGSGPNCPEGIANASPVTPNVWLVIDGSSSMNQPFQGAATRWQTLRSTLMDPGGVVEQLQGAARIGMVIYAGSGGAAGTDECVQLIIVEPALNNYANLSAQYPLDPVAMGTPTDKALDRVVTTLPVLNKDKLDTDVDPTYVVLATDGQPNDSCGSGNLGGGGRNDPAVEQRVIDVVTRGTMMGMEMFIISLAGDDGQLQGHLEQVAMATASKTPPFIPSTQMELVSTFQTIIGGATCRVDLNGMVKDGQGCTGKVELNGTALTCDSDNGWKLINPTTVQLTGTACDMFRTSQSQVHATFPCGAFAPF